jgi:acyl carrier protein
MSCAEVAERDRLFQLIAGTLARVLGVDPGEISSDTHLVDDLNVESVEAVEVVQELEKELGIRIDVRKAMGLRRVSELVAFLGANRRA